MGNLVLVAESRHRRFALVPLTDDDVRWIESGVYDSNSARMLHDLSQISDSSFLVSRRLRPPALTVGDPRLLAVVSTQDGRVLRDFLDDSPISLANKNTSTGRNARACALRDGPRTLVAVANQWMGQIVLIELADEPTLIRSIDVTPDWYTPRPHPNEPRDARPPLGGARIACGSNFAVVSYRQLIPQERSSLLSARPPPELAKTRVAVVGSDGALLFLRDYDLPTWPQVGAAVLTGGGGSRFLGTAAEYEMFPGVAVYEVRFRDGRAILP
jgi:hypothetical protein